MTHPERSAQIFELATQAGIPLSPGEEEVLDDADFLRFCESYRAWATERDRVLRTYLDATPLPSRCYVPYNPRVFYVTHEVMWYFDEVVVRDPVGLSMPPLDAVDLEKHKVQMRNAIQLLGQFRKSVEDGYMLLAGDDIIPQLGDVTPPVVNELLGRPELIEVLDQAVRFGMDKRSDDQGRIWTVFDAHLDSGWMAGWHVQQLVGTARSPTIVVGESLPRSTALSVSSAIGAEVYESVRPLYAREIHWILHAAALAGSLKAAALVDRQLDAATLALAGNPGIDLRRQAATVGTFNLTLPYLQGVPADRLAEIRNAMPEAFHDFRARMSGIVLRAMNEDPHNAQELARSLVEQELVPQVRALELEMKAITSKTRILGYGVPLVTALGTLYGAAGGITMVAILPMVVAGAAAAVKAAADSVAGRTKLEGNPFYFLWRAQRK